MIACGRIGQSAIGVSEVVLDTGLLDDFHTYTIDWRVDGATFTVDACCCCWKRIVCQPSLSALLRGSITSMRLSHHRAILDGVCWMCHKRKASSSSASTLSDCNGSISIVNHFLCETGLLPPIRPFHRQPEHPIRDR